MISQPPPWPLQAAPYVTYALSHAVTDTPAKFIQRGSASALQPPEDQKLDSLETLKADWDGRGSPPPSEGAIEAARKWLLPLYVAAIESGLAWRTPHISASDGAEVTFEWWRDNRKVTLYFSDRAPEYVKVWGPHIFDQMQSGEIPASESFRAIWLWLNAAT